MIMFHLAHEMSHGFKSFTKGLKQLHPKANNYILIKMVDVSESIVNSLLESCKCFKTASIIQLVIETTG